MVESASNVAAVGGIYSVIKSKAPVTTAEYGDRYVLIGPLNPASVSHLVSLHCWIRPDALQAAVEVELLTPTNPELAESITNMQNRGIGLVYGRWLIEGAPRVLLLDTRTGYRWLDEWKADLWNTAGIPSPPGDDETNEAVVFGYLVAWFLGEVSPWVDEIKAELTSASVCLSRKKEGDRCPFSRVAGRSCAASYEKTAH